MRLKTPTRSSHTGVRTSCTEVYALAALAYIEALRGNEKTFKARIDTLDETSWRSGLPLMISELLLNRGNAYRMLGDYERAVEWLERARDFSGEHGNNQVTFQEEAVLEALRLGDLAGAITPNLRTSTSLEEVAGVRDGLSVPRQELALA